VGQKKANAFGLYEMHGNVWEWRLDGYRPTPYPETPLVDPLRAPTAISHLLRGGGFCYPIYLTRSAARMSHNLHDRERSIGFRVVCVR